MSRPKREWYPGAVYHVMARGVRRTNIYNNDFDYQTFVEMLKQGLQKFDCELYSYCLMSNHFHFLIKTQYEPLWKLMKWLSHSYAVYYNSVNSYTGHLFEGRYKSCLVKDDGYFLQTSRYIHLNPVKARIVSEPEEYRWSSYGAYMGTGNTGLVKKDDVLNYFKDDKVLRYREFVESEGRYEEEENLVRTDIGETELWLPW